MRALLEARGPGSRGRRAADRARDPGRRQVARLRRQPSGDRRAAARPGAAPGRHPRPARPAAAVSSPRRNCEFWTPSPGRAETARARCARRTLTWRACRQELDELERNEQEKLRLADLWSFQRREIEGGRAEAGRGRRTRDRAAACCRTSRASRRPPRRLRGALRIARVGAGRDPLGRRGGWRNWGASTRRSGPVAENLKPAEFAVEEAVLALRDYLSHLEADPERLEADRVAPGRARQAEAQVRRDARGGARVSGRGARATGARSRTPTSGARRWRSG